VELDLCTHYTLHSLPLYSLCTHYAGAWSWICIHYTLHSLPLYSLCTHYRCVELDLPPRARLIIRKQVSALEGGSTRLQLKHQVHCTPCTLHSLYLLHTLYTALTAHCTHCTLYTLHSLHTALTALSIHCTHCTPGHGRCIGARVRRGSFAAATRAALELERQPTH
jgi:hypothetical protein